MMRVARERKVLLINSIGMRMPLPGRSTMVTRRILRKASSILKFLKQPVDDLPGFHVMTPLMLPLYGVPQARAINARLVAAQVSWACRHIAIDDPTYLVTIPTAWEVLSHLPAGPVIYNRSDRHSSFEEADQRYIEDLERVLLGHASRVLYVSTALMDEERALTGDRAEFLDHGVDLDHFTMTAGEEPKDLCEIPHPRIGFFGTFDDYVIDLDLLVEVARQLPDAHLVLIGSANFSLQPLLDLPNVHWLGARSYADIPAYGSGFDVALMPWLRNDWIRYANPIKMKEYLALGLPVVSTEFPEVERYRPWIRVARDTDEFVDLVRRTLDDGGLATPQDRRAAVVHETWDDRVQRLLGVRSPEEPEDLPTAQAS
jgi:glycosyltransferase involved in cell wall biosynthesis